MDASPMLKETQLTSPKSSRPDERTRETKKCPNCNVCMTMLTALTEEACFYSVVPILVTLILETCF